MENRICYVVGSGENYGLESIEKEKGYIIAADGGFRYLQEAGLGADLVIGDFDSLGNNPRHDNVITLSKEKDYTDMLAAVHEGIKKGFDMFHIYCGTGGRLDHTIANIQVISSLSENGKCGMLFDKECIITAITDKKLIFNDRCRGYLSLFSYTEVCGGVFAKGFRYELDNACLTSRFPIGVSNEFTGQDGVVYLNSGILLICFPRGFENEVTFIGKNK